MKDVLAAGPTPHELLERDLERDERVVPGLPILVGPSRKSFLKTALGDGPPSEREWGTAAAVTAAILHGAHIVRVHGVGAMVQVAREGKGPAEQTAAIGCSIKWKRA